MLDSSRYLFLGFWAHTVQTCSFLDHSIFHGNMSSNLSFIYVLYVTVKIVTSCFSEKQSLAQEKALNLKRGRKKILCKTRCIWGTHPYWWTAGQKRREIERNTTRWHVMDPNPSLDGTMSSNSTENATFGWQRQIMLWCTDVTQAAMMKVLGERQSVQCNKKCEFADSKWEREIT